MPSSCYCIWLSQKWSKVLCVFSFLFSDNSLTVTLHKKLKKNPVRYEFSRLPLVAGLLRHRCSPSTAVIFRSLCVSPLLITCTWASAVPTGSPPVYQNSDSSTWLTFLGNGRIAGSQIWQSGWLVNQNWVGVASAQFFSVLFIGIHRNSGCLCWIFSLGCLSTLQISQ